MTKAEREALEALATKWGEIAANKECHQMYALAHGAARVELLSLLLTLDKPATESAKDRASVNWFSGWYATRLHAVDEAVPIQERGMSIRSECGAFVYSKPRTAWAQRRMEKGIPRCKHCEKIIADRNPLERRPDAP